MLKSITEKALKLSEIREAAERPKRDHGTDRRAEDDEETAA